MKAVESKLLGFLDKSSQLVIPIYQRAYSWGERECRQLWEDILRAGRNELVSAHFVGSIVYVEKGIYSVSSQSPLLVIDGQQRLTTVMLIIEALSRNLGDSEPIEGFSTRYLRNHYLLDPREDGERKYKLILSQTDKPSLVALMDQQPMPKEYSIRVKENFDFFNDQIHKSKEDLETICRGLAKLMIVDISLDRDQDNPQLIFESLNSTGLDLSQADLIRNFILMGLEPEEQTRLYERYWRPMELNFGQEAYATYFDGFMRHYLTVKTDEIPKLRGVYDAFKEYANSAGMDGMESLVSDINTYAEYYCCMALGNEPDKELKYAFHDLRELKVDVAYPLLLELYHDYANEVLSKEEMLESVRLLESYVFRRAVCAIPTNSMNKTFATFSRALKKDTYLESLKAHFLSLPSYRRFPLDDEFKRDIQIKDLYNFRSRSYWLRRLENFGRKERVSLADYTIEHILPQNPDLSDGWKINLGHEWENVQNTYKHTLGNLTLTGYNSEYSDRPFSEKRDMHGGFRESPLRMNQGLGQLEQWNMESIQQRAERLAEHATEVWSVPYLESFVLENYKPETSSHDYCIADHPNLSTGQMRELFEAFRKEVMALDPCVSEEFKKHYIAYKAETNFVDVIPQAKRLLLSINVHFPEIDDPKEICRDVSGIGRWGNGEVEAGLSSMEEMPYIMGLVRQAFERQMGNGNDI